MKTAQKPTWKTTRVRRPAKIDIRSFDVEAGTGDLLLTVSHPNGKEVQRRWHWDWWTLQAIEEVIQEAREETRKRDPEDYAFAVKEGLI